jgi:hypothetical protein
MHGAHRARLTAARSQPHVSDDIQRSAQHEQANDPRLEAPAEVQRGSIVGGEPVRFCPTHPAECGDDESSWDQHGESNHCGIDIARTDSTDNTPTPIATDATNPARAGRAELSEGMPARAERQRSQAAIEATTHTAKLATLTLLRGATLAAEHGAAIVETSA